MKTITTTPENYIENITRMLMCAGTSGSSPYPLGFNKNDYECFKEVFANFITKHEDDYSEVPQFYLGYMGYTFIITQDLSIA